MQTKGSGISDVGIIRDNNEDFYLINEELGLYIVCDGVGGGNGGEVASKMAAETCSEYIEANKHIIEEYFCLGNNDALIHSLMQSAVLHACKTVYLEGQKQPELDGMSTTFTAVLILNSKALLGHVGDSRLYLARNSEVYQITEDHTVGHEIRERSISSHRAVTAYRFDSILKKSIGFSQTVEADTMLFDLLPGDQLLLCSDGLYNNISKSIEFLPIIRQDPEIVLKDLIELANNRGGRDNITCILINCTLEEESYEDFCEDKEELLNDLSIFDNFLFKDMNFTRINRLINSVDTYEIDKDEIICDMGRCPHGLFIVLKGTVEVYNDDKRIGTLKRKQFFGQYSLMMEKKEKFTYIAGEKCKVIYLETDRYRQLCRNHPKFGVQLLENFIKGCESLMTSSLP